MLDAQDWMSARSYIESAAVQIMLDRPIRCSTDYMYYHINDFSKWTS